MEQVQVCLTEEEVFQCLRHGEVRRHGPVFDRVREGALLLVGAYCLVAFCIEPEAMTLFLALIAVGLAVLLHILPDKRLRSMARSMAGQKTDVTVTETGLRFGADGEEYPYARLDCVRLPGLRVLRFPGQVVGLPDRAFSAETLERWQTVLPGRERNRRKK